MIIRTLIVFISSIGLCYSQPVDTKTISSGIMDIVQSDKKTSASFYYLEKAKIARQSGLLKDAIEATDKAIEQDYENLEAHLFLASIYNETREYNLALKSFLNASNLKPEDSEILYNIGICYYELAEYASATEYLSYAMDADTNNLQAITFRGHSFLMLNSFKDALQDYNKAIVKGGETTGILRGIGYANMELGNYLEAINILNRAVEMNPNDGRSYHYRGLAYLKSFQKVKACADFSKALQLGVREASTFIAENCN